MVDNLPFMHRFDGIAWRFTIDVFIGSTLVWVVTREVGGHNSTWAIAAIVASVDPQMDMAARRIEFGLAKVAELLFGCVVGLAVSWLMSRLWPMPLPQPQPAGP